MSSVIIAVARICAIRHRAPNENEKEVVHCNCNIDCAAKPH